MREAEVTLIMKKNKTEDLKTEVFAEIYPVGRDEFNLVGQKGLKASFKVEVWEFEYDGQKEIIVDEKKLTIYRTYGPKENEKIELYTAERVGTV